MKLNLIILFLILSAEVKAFSASEQQRSLWALIKGREYTFMPMQKPIGLDVRYLYNSDFLSRVFKGNTCPMLSDRKKIIHSLGAAAKLTYIPKASEYTGIFSKETLGILRLSLLEKPKFDNYKPGLAIMFFIDDKEPLTMLAMPSFDGQKEHNIFLKDFSNIPFCSHKNPVFEKQCCKALRKASYSHHDIHGLSTLHLAQQEGHVKAPYELIFRPTEQAKLLLTNMQSGEDFRDFLNKKGDKLTLFYILAKASKESLEQVIGEIILTSDFILSAFADENWRIVHPSCMLQD
jgi:hypothetical protein